MTPELKTAIENAYREFAAYRLRGPIRVCRCAVCVSEENERALATMPLRGMPSHLLAEYTNSAHGWDDRVADELRYFLPRYFELIAAGDPPTNVGIETCLGRLYDARYRVNWPACEAAAIDAFFAALFRMQLRVPPEFDRTGLPLYDADEVEDTLCMVAHAGGDIGALLDIWDGQHGRAATLHIANIIAKIDWRKKRLENSCWRGSARREHVEAAMRDVMAWLLRPETCERLVGACLAEDDDAAGMLLSHAEELAMSAVYEACDQPAE